MSSTRTSSRKHSAGFTLIEMLVVAPLVILVIGGVVGLMIALVSDTVISAKRNNLTATIHSSLDAIEKDIKIATSINASSGNLPSPQGFNDTTNPFNSSGSGNDAAIILTQYATSANPYESERNLIYYDNPPASAQNPTRCNTSQATLNPALTVKVIYFVKGTSLYRRTIVPDVANNNPITCSNIRPWQKNSCTTAGTGICATKDTKLADNVSKFTLEYLNPTETSTSAATTETTGVRVTLELTGNTAGTSVKTSGVMRASKTNN